jgi:hypothetical protein
LIIENNVFVEADDTTIVWLNGYAPGSAFRFNTVVNTSIVGGFSECLFCGGVAAAIDVTSNIFACNSTSPATYCNGRRSLFDLAAQGSPMGPNSIAGDPGGFFVNRAAGDYHLAAGSPALGLGEAGVVTTDIEGKPRPNPTGSEPDSGAFEAP